MRFVSWDFDYAVVRLGPVGLWIALNCHAAGNRVVALDSSASRLVSIAAGLVDLSPHDRERLDSALVSPTFQMGVDLRLVERAHTVIVCVPTTGGGRLVHDQTDPSTNRESILARLSDEQRFCVASSTETGLRGEPWQWDLPPAAPIFGRQTSRGPRADRPAGSVLRSQHVAPAVSIGVHFTGESGGGARTGTAHHRITHIVQRIASSLRRRHRDDSVKHPADD